MSERINELLKQSRTEHWTQYTPSYDYEKFAELIVRECMNIAQNVCLGDESGEHGPTVGFVIKDIQQHFGVK